MQDPVKNYELLKEGALFRGASLFGVADISGHRDRIAVSPPARLDGLDRAVCLGWHLSDAVLETITDRPNKLYYRHYKMVNILLDQLALQTVEDVQRRGFNALPIPASQVLDWDGLSSHASHRAIARLAGLGWIGRSSLLVNPRYGSRVRYVSILTDMPLAADSPITGGCGGCRACVDACPAGAIGMDRFDVDACHQLLKHFGKTLHVSLICGVCLRACRGQRGEGGWEK